MFLFLLGTVLAPQLSAELINIDVDEMRRLMDEGVSVVDVRRADEWQQTGVVEGSHLHRFSQPRGKYELRGLHGLQPIA